MRVLIFLNFVSNHLIWSNCTATNTFVRSMHLLWKLSTGSILATQWCALNNVNILHMAIDNATLHNATLRHTTLHYTTLHYTTQHFTALQNTTEHFTTLHYNTLHNTMPQYLTPNTSYTEGKKILSTWDKLITTVIQLHAHWKLQGWKSGWQFPEHNNLS